MDKNSPSLTHAEEINPEMKAYYANRPLMWRNLAMIAVLSMGWSAAFTIAGPLIQLRLYKMGLGTGALGDFGMGMSWVTGFLTMYFAWKSDHTFTRWGRRLPYLYISAPVIILTVILFPLSDVLWILVALWLLQALFMDMQNSTVSLLNIDCMPRRRLARVQALLVIAMTTVSFLALRYGMRLTEISETLPYFVPAGLLVISTLVGGLSIREPPVKCEGRKEYFKPWSAMKVAWTDPRTILLMVSVAFIYSFWVVYNQWIWLYPLNALHLSRVQIGEAIAWGMPLGALVVLPIGWLIDHVSPYKILPIYWLLCGLIVWLLWRAHSESGLVWVACAQATISPLYNAFDLMVYRHRHPNEIGSVTSSLSFVKFGLCAGVMQMVSGNLIQMVHNDYHLAFLFGWVMLFVGMVGLYVYRFWTRTDRAAAVSKAEMMMVGK